MRQLLIVMLVLAGWEALARLGLLNAVIIGSPVSGLPPLVNLRLNTIESTLQS